MPFHHRSGKGAGNHSPMHPSDNSARIPGHREATGAQTTSSQRAEQVGSRLHCTDCAQHGHTLSKSRAGSRFPLQGTAAHYPHTGFSSAGLQLASRQLCLFWSHIVLDGTSHALEEGQQQVWPQANRTWSQSGGPRAAHPFPRLGTGSR